jgi:hypothetical protein
LLLEDDRQKNRKATSIADWRHHDLTIHAEIYFLAVGEVDGFAIGRPPGFGGAALGI